MSMEGSSGTHKDGLEWCWNLRSQREGELGVRDPPPVFPPQRGWSPVQLSCTPPWAGRGCYIPLLGQVCHFPLQRPHLTKFFLRPKYFLFL